MTTPGILILDNGAYTIKAGLANDEEWDQPKYAFRAHCPLSFALVLILRLFPNSIVRSKIEKKVFVGDEIESCRDYSGLAYRRPFERVRDDPTRLDNL